MSETFDAAWHGRAMEGDATAVRALVDAALAPLWRFCLYRVGNDRHLCEEVVQETLLCAIRRLSEYEPGRGAGKILSWLTGLARDEIRTQLR